MTRLKPVRIIRQPSSSGSRDKYGLEFIRCVGGQEPQIHELWSFAEDIITREVHPFARIDVCNFSRDCFHTAYVTEIVRRVFIYGQKYMNGSVKWLGVPAPSFGTGVAWTEIFLFPIRVGETDMAMNVGLPQFALDLVSEKEASLGVARSLSIPNTFPLV